MIVHLSVPSENPVRAGKVIAKLIDGELMNYPIINGAVMVMARDGSGTGIEVWPETATQFPGQGEFGTAEGPSHGGGYVKPWDYQMDYQSPVAKYYPVHIAISTKLTPDEIVKLGEAEGWRVMPTDRVKFNLVELWIDNKFLIECIPEQTEMPRYLQFSNPTEAKAFFGPVVEQ